MDGSGAKTVGRGTDKLLSSLRGTDLALRFQPWFGRSGKRYIASVFRVDEAAPVAGLPDFDSCVVMIVSGGRARVVHDVLAIAGIRDRRRAAAFALAYGASEWHVHLSATGESRAVAADLSAAIRTAEPRSA